ncbi:MAG: aminotransferase class V-fold PLP-dependent enzyme, partial [Candidatus Dormibacteraeota bacterium]|nr:aminotransferase class V-fold PLP-dependent enzyme [Candidatus Dormibacteraeota bacterium]
EAAGLVMRSLSEGDLSPEHWADGVDRARAAAGRLIGCEAPDVAFLKSSAEGIGVVALGLDWRPGDEVVVYDQEFPAGVLPWLGLDHLGVVVRFVRDRGRNRFEAADVDALLTSRTRVVCLGLVNFSTGFRAPVEAIRRLCRERDVLFVVDATQALGALTADVREIGCDVLVAHAYKFLMSGHGTAICYFSPTVRNRLRVPEPGWKSVQDHGDASGPPSYEVVRLASDARRFEPSIQDLASVAALGASLGLLTSVGPAAIEERVLGYGQQLAEAVAERGYRVVSSGAAGERSAIVSIERSGVDPRTAAAALRERGVAVAARGGRLRLSCHFYNDSGDLGRLLEALLRR